MYPDGLKKRHGVRNNQDYWLSSSVHVGFSIHCERLISPCWPSLYNKPLPFLSHSVSQYTLERLRLLHKLEDKDLTEALQPAGGAEENYSLGPTSFCSCEVTSWDLLVMFNSALESKWIFLLCLFAWRSENLRAGWDFFPFTEKKKKVIWWKILTHYLLLQRKGRN